MEPAEALEMYERMLLIRQFEQAIQSLFQKGEVQGTTHLYSGQEAVQSVSPRPSDRTTSSPVHIAATGMP